MPLKRVLLVYSSKPPITEYMERAFRKKGIEADHVHADVNSWFDKYVIHNVNKTAHNLRILPKGRDLFKEHPLAHLHYRGTRLAEKIKEYSPDLILLIRGIRFTEDVLKYARENAALFGWWIEKEERMAEAFKEIHLYDHYFFMNSRCVEAAEEKGFTNASALLHSVDTEAFYKMDCPKKYDWCFVGGWSPKRQLFIERALKISKNAAIYGPKWLKKNMLNFTLHKVVKGDYIEGAELVKLYNESKVVLNITNWGFGEGDKRSGMNMRVLEVPASGAAMLTDGSIDLKKIVTPGEHVILYEGINQFGDMLSHYIGNDSERERLALRGCAHVRTNYTYDNVADIIIESYNSMKGLKV
ncbi:MAG: glycosyltransferase [Deltaproteobacteria bacterium]|nr:glycosyltransferase [Deltaproteobacteria bacterium]